MKQFKMLCVVFFLVWAVGAANVYALQIDINAKTATTTDPLTYFFEAGTYEVTVIGVEDGGVYNAWNAWGNIGGNHGWLNSYRISSDEFDISMGDGIRYKDPLDALGNAVGVTFSLLTDGDVNFFIADWPYTDNIGGISLDVAPVPEPATIILLGSGLLGLGVRARKKFKK